MRRLWAVACAFGLVGAVPASAWADGSGVVTRNGRVGPLRLGHSHESAIRDFAGAPNGKRRTRGVGGERITVLRYRCGDGCNTYFYLDRRGRFANFITHNPDYRTADGTRVGDDRKTAVTNENKDPDPFGCSRNEVIARRGTAWLFVTLDEDGKQVWALAAAGGNAILGC